MKGEYEYKNRPLEVRVAKTLIVELFAGKSAHRKKISEKVLGTHIKREGKLPKAISTDPVYLALSKLKKESLATPLGKGIWAIVEENVLFLKEDGVQLSFDFEVLIGKGANSVYVYYYPIYRLYAESQGKNVWACKVGYTKSDPHKRIKSQSSTAIPEHPVVGLVIKTDEPEAVENVLHGILKYRSKFMKDAPGKEWFITSPSEVQQIYNINF